MLLEDLDFASHPLIMLGLAVMLFKGSGRNPFLPGSFRRVQLSSIFLKILQLRCLCHIGKATEKFKHKAQFGFTSGVSFSQSIVLRETVSRWAHYTGKRIYVCSADISMAFNKTLRWLSVYQISRAGERGQLLKFSNACYNNTNFFKNVFSKKCCYSQKF